MKVLQIIAHPDLTLQSFTGQLARRFRKGAEEVGNSVITYNLYDMYHLPSREDFKKLILEAEHICFAWPCMWEMPPADLVDFFQTIFVKDFAFTLVNGKMEPSLNIPVTCLISMGQDKSFNTENLSEAMEYCGLHPKFIIFNNVGPRLTPDKAAAYLDMAQCYGNL